MEMIALGVVGVLALAAMGALAWVCIQMSRAMVKMGNQLTANSDHQLERIRYETGAESVGKYAQSLERVTRNGTAWQPPAEDPDMVVRDRSV